MVLICLELEPLVLHLLQLVRQGLRRRRVRGREVGVLAKERRAAPGLFHGLRAQAAGAGPPPEGRR